MVGFIMFVTIAAVLIITGLINLGSKAREQEKTDKIFFQEQLILAKEECYKISRQFDKQLAFERKKYGKPDRSGVIIYDDWVNEGIESFFQNTVSPQLLDVQRECLIRSSAYPEIIDKVASMAAKEL